MIADALLPLRCDPANKHSECPWWYLVLELVVFDVHGPTVQVTCKRYPAFKVVIEGFRRG